MAVEIRNHGRGHSYRRVETGEKVPGVTTVKDAGLPKPGLMKWHADQVARFAVDHKDEWINLPPIEAYDLLRKAPYRALNKAAVKGSTVHKFADRLLAGETVDVSPELIGYVRSAATFIEEFDFRTWHTEVVVHSADEHDHAGKLDAIGTILLPDLPEYDIYTPDEEGRIPVIVDWKTSASGVYGETAYQLGAYRHSRWMVLPDGEEVEMPHVELTIAVHLAEDGYTAWPLETGPEVYRDFLFVKEVARVTEDAKYLRGDPLIPPRTARYALTKVND
jgi:hypothetical protein